MTARGVSRGRSRPPDTVTGHGEDETAATADLRDRLDERTRPDRLAAIDKRRRAAPPLTADELQRVTKRYAED
jgi:hypothetical protein